MKIKKNPMPEILLHPIATIYNERKTITDDFWGKVESRVVLHKEIHPDALMGLDSFSHVHIIFYFHLVEDAKINMEARHPRNNPDYPRVGIFAQRAKNRPNKIGITVCEIIRVQGNTLLVKGLDAIDGTPVLDIKPYMPEFDIREAHQPAWAHELMQNYFK
jgi:tRNA (adenine37-N6)-methyltransferase